MVGNPLKNTWLLDRHPLYANRLFDRYGHFIAQHPVWFLIIPLVALLACCPGVMKMKRLDNGDTMLWMTPQEEDKRINSLAERKWFTSLPDACSCNNETRTDCADLVPPRCSGGVEDAQAMLGCDRLQVFAFAGPGKSVVDPFVAGEIVRLDTYVSILFNAGEGLANNTRMFFDDYNNTRYSLCQMRADGSCVTFSILTGVRAGMAAPPLRLRAPLQQNNFLYDLMKPENRDQYEQLVVQNFPKKFYYPYDPSGTFIGQIYGDVKYQDPTQTWQKNVKSGVVASAGAMQMFYCFDKAKRNKAAIFARRIKTHLEAKYAKNPNLTVVVASIFGPGEATNNSIIELAVRFLVSFIACLLFVFISAYTFGGNRTAKPWFAVCGVIYQIVAIAASFGILGWTERAIVDFSISAALMLFCIGVGDVYIFLAEWSSTNPEMPVDRRLGKVLRVSAYSIASVALMNIVSFAIDIAMVNATVIKAYSTMATIGLLFQVLLNLTSLPALLALFGKVEKNKNHAIFCCCFENTCCCPSETYDKRREQDLAWKLHQQKELHKSQIDPWYLYHKMSVWGECIPSWARIISFQWSMRNEFMAAINSKIGSVFILLSVFGYAALCGWLCTFIEVGLRPEHLAPSLPDGKPNELEVYVKTFRTFSFQIEVYLKGTDGDEFAYWDPDQRYLILNDLVGDLHLVKNIAPPVIGRFWLRDFVNYTQANSINIDDKDSFLNALQFQWFKNNKTEKIYFTDVRFDDSGDFLESSRFVIFAINSVDVSSSSKIVEGLRHISVKYKAFGVDVKFYSGDFDLVEPMMGVTNIAVWLILVHFTVITVVGNFLWIRPITTFLIGLAAAILFLGIIGFTFAWDVQFDPISVFGIISSISVAMSYPTKVTSALVDAPKGNPTSSRFKRTVANCSLAIFLSSVASLVPIIALATSPIYLVSTYFKFTFITLLITCYISAFVLPIIAFHLRIKK